MLFMKISLFFNEYYCFHRLSILFFFDDSATVMTMVAIAPIIVIQSLSFIVNSPFSVVDVVYENFSFFLMSITAFTGCWIFFLRRLRYCDDNGGDCSDNCDPVTAFHVKSPFFCGWHWWSRRGAIPRPEDLRSAYFRRTISAPSSYSKPLKAYFSGKKQKIFFILSSGIS